MTHNATSTVSFRPLGKQIIVELPVNVIIEIFWTAVYRNCLLAVTTQLWQVLLA